ncbi:MULTISPECIES: histidine phosphatase family protein [unclassified Leptolyngbya]|uniref:histidine phosphatase family protein n=1 Tax=unclassified Leptolyngbya TaxID=2650499 RepID=UPI001684C53B|nr:MULTISPECIES: histidine phosphatase family protein [unclassified Leptolyngbya]MBD1913718.1 histidine phosphatase family protein [Leptolyngbya sp. FACHB-8]MBD2155318.1 histidine phosphatase family protein [Leptolyngbya sp. FACHB-16]
MTPLKLLFIRHAQSVGNVEKRMQGNADFPLTEEGRRQAAKLAQRLREEGWRPTHIYSSPIKRTVQTTEILLSHFLADFLPTSLRDETGVNELNPMEPEITAAALGGSGDLSPIPVSYADALVEHKNGQFEGLTWAEAQEKFPQLCLQLETSLDWIPVPGAETLMDARDRTQQFISDLVERHQNGDHVLIVTHSWILQHLLATLLGCDRTWRIASRNTGMFEFWIERSRWFRPDPQTRLNTDLWQVRRFNDHHHLL